MPRCSSVAEGTGGGGRGEDTAPTLMSLGAGRGAWGAGTRDAGRGTRGAKHRAWASKAYGEREREGDCLREGERGCELGTSRLSDACLLTVRS